MFPALISIVMPTSRSIWVSTQETREKGREWTHGTEVSIGGRVPEIAWFGTLKRMSKVKCEKHQTKHNLCFAQGLLGSMTTPCIWINIILIDITDLIACEYSNIFKWIFHKFTKWNKSSRNWIRLQDSVLVRLSQINLKTSRVSGPTDHGYRFSIC